MVVLKRLADAERDGDTHLRRASRASARRATARANAIYAPSADGQTKALRNAYQLRRRDARHDRAGRGARHRHEGRRRGRGRRRSPRCTAAGDAEAAAVVRRRLGEVADRPHEGGGRGGGAHQGGAGAAPQGAAADDQGDAAGRAAARGRLAVLREHRDAAVAAAGRAPAAGGAVARSASAAATSTRCWKSTGREKAEPDWDGPRRDRRRSAPTRRRHSRPNWSTAADRRGPRSPAPRKRRARAFRRRRRVPAVLRRPPRRAPTCRSCSPSAKAKLARRAGRAELAHARRRALRPRPGAGQARGAVPRPGVAVRRHAPRPGVPVPRGARRARRPRTRPSPLAGRADAAVATASTRRPRSTPEREDASDDAPARHRRRPAGPRRGELRGVARAASGSALKADAFAGHSYGELVALAAAGRLDAGRPVRAVPRSAGELMAEQRRRRPRRDAGRARPAAGHRARSSRARSSNLVVANKNAPKQTVLSGADGRDRARPRRRFAAPG